MIHPEVPKPKNDHSLKLFISEESYKYKNENKEGFGPFLKNGLFFRYPCCCFFWLCPKYKPTTKVNCPFNKDDDLEYKAYDNGQSERCNVCMRNMDEFFVCEDKHCKYHICLDCHIEPVPKQRGCLCCVIRMKDVEEKARQKAGEAYTKVSSQTDNLFVQLKGDNLTEEEKDSHLRKLFAQFDTDGSGTLQLKELQSFLGNYIRANFGQQLDKAVDKYEQVQNEFWANMYKILDKNGDGQIDTNEFKETIQEVFEKLMDKMKTSIQSVYDEALKRIDAIDGEVDMVPQKKDEPIKEQEEQNLNNEENESNVQSKVL